MIHLQSKKNQLMLQPLEKQTIYNLHDLGKDSKNIAKLIGRSITCVARTIANRPGDALYETHPCGRRIYTLDHINRLKALYAEGLSIRDIGKKFFMTNISVRNIVIGHLPKSKNEKAPPIPAVLPKHATLEFEQPTNQEYVFHLTIGLEELKMVQHLMKHFIDNLTKGKE